MTNQKPCSNYPYMRKVTSDKAVFLQTPSYLDVQISNYNKREDIHSENIRKKKRMWIKEIPVISLPFDWILFSRRNGQIVQSST